MQTIKRDIYVTKNVLQAPIEVTEGTNSIAIEFDVRDYDIPASAAAVAYSLSTSSMEEPNKALADVSGNKITIIPSETFFLPGQNVMQVRIIDGNSKLISFNIIVKCTGKMRFGDEDEEGQSTLIEQMLAKLGEYQKKSASPYNFKGSCLSSALPTSGNTINDTYYCTDLKYRKTWNGTAWEQSSLNEADYEDELTKTNGEVSSLKEDINITAFNSRMLKSFGSNIDETYNDANNLPTNSIVTYAGPAYPSNIPRQYPCTIMTYSYNTDKTITANPGVIGGATQILTNPDNQMWFRLIWGSTPGWTEWARLDSVDNAFNSRMLKSFGSNIDETYNDANNLPTNSIVTYAGPAYPSNIPRQYPCTIMTYSYNTDKTITANPGVIGGATQILTNPDNQMWFRLIWGSTPGWTEWARLDKQYEASYITTGCYKTFGVIGDSYASGETYYNGSYHDNYYQSWGQVLARKLGNSCTNFSKGGATTRSWLTDNTGLPKLENSTACDLYWCALGINDASKLGNAYLGTIDDMHTDYTTNPDTFCGNYGRIIGNILKKNKNATIILTNIVLTGSPYDSFSAAIKEIAKKAGVMFIDTHSGFFTSSAFKNTMVSGHPTNQTYTGMANMYDELFSKNYEQYHDYLFEKYGGYVQ